MKIKALELSTKRPLVNLKIQLQIKGKESGFLSVTTDANGEITIDDKYRGHQIAALLNGAQGAWVAAMDNATILLDTKKTTAGGPKDKEKNRETWK